MDLQTPIVTEPVPAIVADKMLASAISIGRKQDGAYATSVELQFYGENAAGVKQFALSVNGQKRTAYLTTQDVLALGAKVPSILLAFAAIERGLADWYAYEQANPPIAGPQVPPVNN